MIIDSLYAIGYLRVLYIISHILSCLPIVGTCASLNARISYHSVSILSPTVSLPLLIAWRLVMTL